ncbi:hypothetical protein [Hymenobacter negativus]|uniref:ArsR family transcriptional regulator n=1 Tax=Hymenobacter negativus TaxID=2795026 RepID=A0ABS3QK66_9BACT|nr:hypothetical protein [Hymenobacter negativus]MBO2011639.1 hypothetical protein [Hymenobacter negativus]
MATTPAPDATPDTLAARFAQRLIERDAPPPPPSQEPTAVLTRIQAWLIPPEGVRDARTHHRMARMLVALMEHSELHTEQLQLAAGLGWRAGSRLALELLRRGLTARERRGRFFYHRLTRAAEDSLLLVVAGPQGGCFLELHSSALSPLK